MERVTIKDVAERAGVSSSTVSNVIHDKGKASEKTRRAVLQAIEALNYRPNASAQRRLQRATQKSIGLVVKEIHNPYFADVIVGAQEEANEQGYNLMVSSSEGRRVTEGRAVDLFVAKDVDGLIINPLLDSEADLSHLFDLKRRNIPFVLLERVRGLQANLVDVDNTSAARDAALHLLGLGHERIVHFAGPAYSMHAEERMEGFRQAFFESQLVFSEDLVVPAGARLEDGYRSGRTYFGARAEVAGRPTAAMCYNDLVAIGLLRALREQGLRVPEDISVIGFDDINLCDFAPVPLTTMDVPKREMGRKAVELLLRQIETADGHAPEQVNLQAELVLRASTAPVSQEVSA